LKKIKVVHLLWVGGIGGTEQSTTTLIEYFSTSKYEIHLCFVSKKGEIYEEARKKYSNVAFIGMRNGYDLLGALRLYRYLCRGNFDIIHMHNHNLLTNFVVSLVKKSKRIYHDGSSPGGTAGFYKTKKKLMYRLFSKSYTKITANSKAIKQYIIEDMRVDPKKVEVVHNGINMNKFNFNKTEPVKDLMDIKKQNVEIIGFVGRLIDFKRPLLFIDIAKELLTKRNDFHFIMVGDGPEYENCKMRIRKYGLENRFTLLGFRRDIPNILKTFDALIFTSKGEGFGNVVPEALAMGVPVFAINSGVIPEFITDKHNGILLETENPADSAEKILGVLNDKVLLKKISKEAIADIRERFSMENWAKKFDRIYNSVLEE